MINRLKRKNLRNREPKINSNQDIGKDNLLKNLQIVYYVEKILKLNWDYVCDLCGKILKFFSDI